MRKNKTPQLIEKFFSSEDYKIIHHEKNKNLGGFLKLPLMIVQLNT